MQATGSGLPSKERALVYCDCFNSEKYLSAGHFLDATWQNNLLILAMKGLSINSSVINFQPKKPQLVRMKISTNRVPSSMKSAPSLSATPEDWSQLFQVSKTQKIISKQTDKKHTVMDK